MVALAEFETDFDGVTLALLVIVLEPVTVGVGVICKRRNKFCRVVGGAPCVGDAVGEYVRVKIAVNNWNRS